jgi:2-keto-3-deoxy-L-rhamnonate aldolase RhmA
MTSLKQLLRDKDVVVGATAMEFLRPALVKLYKHAGFDFIYLEYEHALMDPSAFNDFVISAQDNHLAVVAKTPDLCSGEDAGSLPASDREDSRVRSVGNSAS